MVRERLPAHCRHHRGRPAAYSLPRQDGERPVRLDREALGFLKRKYGVHYSVKDAARDFAAKYGKDGSPFPLSLLSAAIDRLLGKRR
jgi:hypothetical protein